MRALVPPKALTGSAPEGGPWALAFAESAQGTPVKTRSLRRSELTLFGADPDLPQQSWVTLKAASPLGKGEPTASP